MYLNAFMDWLKTKAAEEGGPPLPGQAQAASPSWCVDPDNFRKEFTIYLEGPKSAGGVTVSANYTGPVYNKAMPALSTKLQSSAASLSPNAPCPWNLQTAAGLYEALVENKLQEYMSQKHGNNGKIYFNKFMKWLKAKAEEEGAPPSKKQKTLSFKNT